MEMESNASVDAAEQLQKLEARVRSWKKWVSGIAACLIGAYLIYFGLILGQNPATDSDKWGAFGDFIGGVLNPIVAFAAFFWLTESVKIQKEELAKAHAALSNANKAQEKLVENGRNSEKLAALNALINANYSKLKSLNERIQEMDRAIRTGQTVAGAGVAVGSVMAEQQEVIGKATALEKLIDSLHEELQAIYESTKSN
ncbi:large-conductance mechanosensitive channel [Comamonas sp. BIGb0152]|uniref:hypothetical protein n=1 Tax=Comamonas sp. BIGb0152 TaxID=2940601 RepID=UPI002168D4EB|nr:hypothetical protein [Comamonas sp. BIGb0152]MCS4292715.1 large-conductance mechanosensitive channel [Comamonas sp. BIGb0152]